MIFWVFAIVLTAGTFYAVARPLLRETQDALPQADTADYDVAVFKSQLREIDRDLSLNRITVEEAEASRVEIGRRLLAADKRRTDAQNTPAPQAVGVKAFSLLLVSGALAATVFLYSRTGDPSNPDMPYALRQAELQLAQNPNAAAPPHNTDGSEAGDLDQMAESLRARLDAGEGGPEDWSLLGRTEMMRGNYKLAADAYAEALRDFPDDSALNSAYGEALVFWAGGSVTDQAMGVFTKVLQLTPNDPRGHFYLGEYDRQNGNLQDALDRWVTMLNNAGPEATWTGVVREKAEELAGQMGVDLNALLSAAPPSAPPVGPSEDEVSAAMDMSPEDRQAMVQGMVDGLAERLAQDPSDFDGWLRLIRSRVVLGDIEGAQASLAEAMAQFANAPFPMQNLTALAQELELELELPGGGAETSEQRGPSAEDMAAAQDMDPEDRQAMIEGMVENLASRLQEDPTDLEGWTMLARSYTVLGRLDESIYAYARASELAPGDTSLLLDRARLMRSQAGEQQTPETVALMTQVAAIEPDNIEALWFLGLDAYRAQNLEQARSYFDRAMNGFPEGAPERTSLEAEIERMFATQPSE